MSRIDRYFKLTERKSTYGREVRGGFATFFAMVYIVVLNPLILSGPDGSGHTLGIPQVAAMTAVVSGVMTILMGFVARYPFALSAGLGVSGFVSATITTTKGLTWPDVMGLIVVSGVVVFVLVLLGFREAVFRAVPSGLKIAIVAGIGLFIATIGFVNAGFIRRVPDSAHTPVPVSLGNGGILIGIIGTTIFAMIVQLFTNTPAGQGTNPVGWSLTVPVLPKEFVSLPDLSLFGKIDLVGGFSHIGVISATLLTFTILLTVFFDSMGTMTELASQGGARTGLAAIVTGLLFIIISFFAPLAGIVPFEAVAPALVIVG